MAGYSAKAQPYLNAIAEGFFSSAQVRAWLLRDTPHADTYCDAEALHDEQRDVRWVTKPTLQPFWANYWCGRDTRCTCRVADSRSLESDAIFFLRNAASRVLAIHVEFKHPSETFMLGQPEGYPLRAACFASTHHLRRTMNAHDDWTTIIFCGAEAVSDHRLTSFQRVILHNDARKMLAGYPDV